MDLLQLAVHNIFSFFVIISIIVFIHEYGHYYIAKINGVKIDSFSIGFGPEVFGWNDKTGTRWKISAVPLGGYVKMFGDESAASTPDNEKLKSMSEEEKSGAFHLKNVWQRMAVVIAGPAANFILAIFILTFFFMVYGRSETSNEIGEVMDNSAAIEAGLQVGDIITSIDGSKIERFEDIVGIIAIHPDIELELKYLRDDVENIVKITPKKVEATNIFGDTEKKGLIGIAPVLKSNHETLGFFEAVKTSVIETYVMSARTLQALGQMITGQRPADQLSGILRIGDYSGKAVSMGIQTVLWFMAVLSINLGLINLFPIPMLDGGHLVLYAFEATLGKPLPEKVQEYGFRFGFILLIALMLFATFNDLKHFGIF